MKVKSPKAESQRRSFKANDKVRVSKLKSKQNLLYQGLYWWHCKHGPETTILKQKQQLFLAGVIPFFLFFPFLSSFLTISLCLFFNMFLVALDNGNVFRVRIMVWIIFILLYPEKSIKYISCQIYFQSLFFLLFVCFLMRIN